MLTGPVNLLKGAVYLSRNIFIQFLTILVKAGLVMGPLCPSIRTCPQYIIKLAICTAVFSEVWVRLELVQHGVIGLKWDCGVNLVSLTP